MKTFNFSGIGISFDDGFIVYIDDELKQYSTWIYHKDYKIKYFMFSVDKLRKSMQDVIDMAKESYLEYATIYKQKYIESEN